MATFLQVTTRILQLINRPSSEADVLAAVKASINDAVDYLQRNHAYALTEKLSTFVYPANALSVDLGTLCGGPLRDVISLQQLASSGTYEGKPIKIKSYAQIQADRRRYQRSHSTDPSEIFDPNVYGLTIEDGYRCDMIAWVMGQYIGMYPRPSAATTFILHYHVWLPVMADDTDTNFYLTYCQDVIVTIALKRLHLFMKVDSRFAVSQAEVQTLVEGVLAWDSQIKENPATSIG